VVRRGTRAARPRSCDQRIAAIVNAAHPGRATHRELSGLDHCWTRHETMEKSRGRCGMGETVPTLSDTVLAFLASSIL
jgi:hypothetical protein